MRQVLLLIAAAVIAGCASPAERIDRAATANGMSRTVVQGTTFRHVVYRRAAHADARDRETGVQVPQAQEPTRSWRVYLEGDGVPWIEGRMPATDPTTRNPIALRLMAKSPTPALYVSRPCYQELRDAACSAAQWTFGRYSEAIVESMAAAIASQLRDANANEVTLVGYSGGGVLAVLIAERLTNVSEVVTIAANLDVAAWSAHHGYLPLTDSLDPVLSTREHSWREIHLQGADDRTVPIATTTAYFKRYPGARAIAFETYDHTCCWERDWGIVEERIATQAPLTRADTPHVKR